MSMSLMDRRRFIGAAGAFAGATFLPGANAQSAWPNKPIRFVLGYPPGGGTDVMARLVGGPASAILGQTIVVDNKPGASGNIATAEVARAAPDGYTFLAGPSTNMSANPFLFTLNFNPANDLVPVAALGRLQLYLATRVDHPAKTIRQLIEYGRANPGKLTYASSGPGTPPHLVSEYFLRKAGITAVQVPYRGAAPALQAVLAGECDFVIDPGIAIPHVRAGKLALLGVASTKRPSGFPEVPTLIESGIAGADFDAWIGVWAPAATPADARNKMSAALSQALAQPAVKEKFAALNAEALYQDAGGMQKIVERESGIFSGLVKELNLKLD